MRISDWSSDVCSSDLATGASIRGSVPTTPTPINCLRLALLAMAVLLGSGCERALFGFLNRGLPPPESTAVFAPELGLALDIYRPTRPAATPTPVVLFFRSEEHTSELQSLLRISYAVFCLKKKKKIQP